MKRTGKKAACAKFFLAMVSAVMVTNADGGDNSRPLQASPEIVLNGITTIFGDKRALFKVVDSSPAPVSRSYFLSEGERNGDVQLLAVDAQAGTIKVSDQGIVQVITICKAPVILAGASTATGNDVSIAGSVDGNDPRTTSAAVAAKSGTGSQGEMQTPTAGQLAVSGGGNSPGNAEKSANSSNDSSSAGSANSASDPSGGSAALDSNSASQNSPWWLKEAQKIEQARQQTAQRVMDGKWQPYPLTPLTPVGTPPQLISSASAYFFYNPTVARD
jgi:hypothetical protein